MTLPAFLRFRYLLLIVLLLTLASGHLSAWSNAKRPVVYVAQVSGMIDLGLAPYIDRVLKEAQVNNAAAVVLQINTFGGRVDAAVQIRDALIKSPVNSIAFIDSRAISAGALISLATHAIVMTPGGTIGAATPVQSSGTETQPVSEKTVSYVRKEFGATAEIRNRDPAIAEAMVDADVVIPGVIEKGKLLTLTTQEALDIGLADAQATTLVQALDEMGIRDARIIDTQTNWAEELVRFLTHPVVSSLLVTVAMLGIILEIRTPGFGVAGVIGISALGLFMWGHWLVSLVGWEELLLAVAGVMLLLIEAFVIPGFGLVGVLGLLAFLAAIMLSTVGAGASFEALLSAATRLGISLTIAIAASLLLLKLMPTTRFGRKLILQTDLDSESGFTSEPHSDHELVGRQGVTATPLRPAGIATIQGKRIDVVSEGDYINVGEPIRVSRVDGNRVVVIRNPEPHSSTGEA